MRRVILLLMMIGFISTTAQNKYFTKTGTTDFKASVEAFEPIEAKNNSTTVVLNSKTGDIAALLFVKSFHFKVALMEEHFNENYMDSDKFPKATFKGTLEGFDFNKIKSEEQEYKLSGTLNIRGKEKAINTISKFSMVDSKILLNSRFVVKPEDFDIDIPKIVRKKIAKEIIVTLEYELVEKK